MSLDLYNLSDNSDKVQIFYSSGVWVKPRGISMVYIVAIGAGAGGGGGLTKAAGVAGAGGSGGGSGAITRSLIPAILVPDNLYINVGIGGTGGGPSVAGGSGGTTTVDVVPNGDLSTFLVLANGGSGGPAGVTSGVAPAAAVGGVAAAAATNPFIIISVFGIIGGTGLNSNGGSTGNGSSPLYAAGGLPITCGAGGGGIAAANAGSTGGATGGVSTFFAPTVGGSGNRDGENGSFSISPFYSQGGAGGGGSGNVSTNSGNGTRGGNGNIGSGGGGGGTGTSPGVAGNGGNGGNGLVVIVCY